MESKSVTKKGSNSTGSNSKKNSNSSTKNRSNSKSSNKSSSTSSKTRKRSSSRRKKETLKALRERKRSVNLKEKVEVVTELRDAIDQSQNKDGYLLRKQMFRNSMPLLILTAGPTGSGKSKLFNTIFHLLYKPSKITKQTFDFFLIDDYVENSDIYKKKVDEILFEYSCIPKQDKSICDFRNPSQDFVNDFFQAYTEARESESQMKLDIDAAIKKRKHVVIETTGKKMPIEYVKKFLGYNVVFVYSLVSIENLVKRNKERAQRQFEKYVKNKKDKKTNNPAPRVIDVSKNEFEKKVQEIIESLKLLRGICMKINKKNDPNIQKCGDIRDSPTYNLILVDNNGRSAKIIYDHTKTERFLSDGEFEKLVRSVVYKS